MERNRFRRLVLRALNGIPPHFAIHLDNVAIVIEREPTAAHRAHTDLADGEDLFGLYVGVPLTERSSGGTSLPDRILIFQGPLERHFAPRDIPREVRRTVMHEVAHHFGIGEARLAELGLD